MIKPYFQHLARLVFAVLCALTLQSAAAPKACAADAFGSSVASTSTRYQVADALPQQIDSLNADAPVSSESGETQQPIVQEVAADKPFTRGAWSSILPPLIAIVIALAFRRVIPALFAGLWVGAVLIRGVTLKGAWMGILDTYQVYVRDSLTNPDHASIVLFTLMIGGMVGIVSKSGGMQGVVNHVAKWATTAKRGQLSVVFMGVAVFFDDYANSLVVGNTMRPVSDSLNISREKLSYIVDSTSAPVACLALVTTWIGYEVGLIGTAMADIGVIQGSAYQIFLDSILYSFYPLLALAFVTMIAWTGRDFGPMLGAERRARSTGAVLGPDARVDVEVSEGSHLMPVEGKPQRPMNAIIPIVVLVLGVIISLFVTGEGDSIKDIIASADSYKALMYASLLGTLVAAFLSVSQKILTIEETVEAWYSGLRSMMFALIILVLAWSLSSTTEILGTAEYLVSVLGDSLAPGIVPAIVFVIAAATAFATGSSWGAMGILIPLVVPLTWAVMEQHGLADGSHYPILYSAISCVLAGSVWGDHCSPISDTTILSSMASGSDHIDHVRTQLPYALSVGVIALLIGTIPTGFGVPWWASMIAGVVVCYLVVRFVGKPVDELQPDLA
ncbi:MAG: Na+/H+ antiporter NhaC family protein [Bacteroidetes bacterium]|nr:Na+/H+ antiporter NhaC family protein [Bacteroidota bacterium]